MIAEYPNLQICEDFINRTYKISGYAVLEDMTEALLNLVREDMRKGKGMFISSMFHTSEEIKNRLTFDNQSLTQDEQEAITESALEALTEAGVFERRQGAGLLAEYAFQKNDFLERLAMRYMLLKEIDIARYSFYFVMVNSVFFKN